jgi:cyclophilin family peptidyl-prolyl cis-trans isomerase
LSISSVILLAPSRLHRTPLADGLIRCILGSMSKKMKIACVVMLATLLQATWLGAEELPEPAEQQVVLDTDHGEFVIDLYPDAAPNHVRKFVERVRNGFYNGTTFHRAIAYGIIQGGDPLSKDPSKRAAYGTGGLMELKREKNAISHRRGTVSAVLVPGDPDSAGSQFFICVTDQVQLDGQFTAFGRVVEGMEVVEKISQLPADGEQKLIERVEMRARLRDRPPPEVIPFVDTPVEELGVYRVIISTDLGEIEIRLFPEEAPGHVRQFLRFARLGLYDGTTFHRVVPGFVLQGGMLAGRGAPVPALYQEWLRNLRPEFNDRRRHVRGTVSMARGEEPDSAMDSFFIVLDEWPHLDGTYTAFGEVTRGMETVDAIVAQPLEGETPSQPVRMRITVLP